MIYVIGGIKGGVGKSTVATNLAVLFLEQGSVLLVDADHQKTSTHFSLFREQELKGSTGYDLLTVDQDEVRENLLESKDKYSTVIVDVGGRDTASQRAALTAADVFLVPLTPRSFDLLTLDAVTSMITEVKEVNPGLKTAAFINRADHRGSDNKELQNFLEQVPALSYLDSPLGDRKAFSNASSVGLSVLEHKPANQKAIEELELLRNKMILL